MRLIRRPDVTSLPARSRRRTLAIAGAAVVALLVVAAGVTAATALTIEGRASAAADVGRAHSSPSPSTGATGGGAASVDTTGFPKGGVGIFTDRCALTKTAPNDPILMPGMTGKSMQHDFFGNTGTTASTTTAQLTGGTSSCSTSADASAYWTPVVYQDGHELRPQGALIYWRAPKATAPRVQTVPSGLTMIAGNEGASTPQVVGIVRWTCSQAVSGGSASPENCPSGTELRLVITFPNCWDGHTLNGATQQNVVYADAATGACPASHPVQIPQIVFHENYPTASAAGLTVSIGPAATGSVTTEHADFMNGWNESTLTNDVKACIDTNTRCGPVRGAAATPRGGLTNEQLRKQRERVLSGAVARGRRVHRRDTAA